MTVSDRPAALARAFTAAWTSHDFDGAATYVADDAVFDGPMGHVEGKDDYIGGLKGLTKALGVTGARVVAAFGDETQALIMYEMATERFGDLTCAKLLTFRDGKIRSDRLTFDSYPVRQGASS